MLYCVRMTVNVPFGLSPDIFDELKETEKVRSQELQRSGKWRHLWRVAGQYANISVFDVADHDELHTLIASLPLFPFMDIDVIPLARHPSAIEESEHAARR